MKSVSFIFLCFSAFCLFTNYDAFPLPGRTGSPGDAQTCKSSGCHLDAPLINTTTSWITTNVPPNGFVKDSTYTVTIKANGPSHGVFGFEAACQNLSGTAVGALGLINTAETQFVDSPKNTYIGQTLAGSRATNTKTWQFSWKAPTTGDTATIYACVMLANGNGAETGDSLFLSKIKLTKAVTTPTIDIETLVKVQVSPNPASISANTPVFNFSKLEVGTWHLRLYNINGACIATETIEGTGNIQYSLPTHNLISGLYAYNITDNTNKPRSSGKILLKE